MANEQLGESTRVDTSDGKYTYIMRKDGTSHALRYGKPWITSLTNIPGCNMTSSLAHDLDEARQEIAKLKAANSDLAARQELLRQEFAGWRFWSAKELAGREPVAR